LEENEVQDYYENSFQHLRDELKRIYLLIHRRIQRLRNERNNDIPDEYKGLFISEEEIDQILKGKTEPGKSENSSASQNCDTEGLLNHLHELRTRISERVTASLEKSVYLSLYHLTQLFHLSIFEVDCLLICLAPELDLTYEKLYAYLQNDVTKKKPTVDLVLNLLCHSIEGKTQARPFFSSHGSMFKNRLLSFSEESQEKQRPLISRSLKLDDRVVDFLLDFHGVDSRIRSFVRVAEPRAELKDVIIPVEVREKIRHLFQTLTAGIDRNKGLSPSFNSVFYLKGPYGNGQRQSAEAICRKIGRNLLEVNTDGMLGCTTPFDISLKLVLREALFKSSAVYFKGFGWLLEEGEKNGIKTALFLDEIEKFPGLIFLEGDRSWEPKFRDSRLRFFTLDYPMPSYSVRKEMWESYLNGYSVEANLDITALANKFQFTGGQIKDAIQTATNLSLIRDTGNSSITPEDLYEGCRIRSNQKLNALSIKVQPRYDWKDIVLPKQNLRQLRDICSYVRYRHIVYGDWGFDKKLSLGKGLNALFHGPSGTGKTMAAEVIAKDLNLDLYKIDLSSVVSKYIGETEKNMSKIFKEAETSNSILFFDEADALFGKRSEVKDAHDRYANIEVAYLLQKMEEHEGIVILATNLMKNMDEAFVRRMHFNVEFPFPDEEHRFRIWERIFPQAAPRDQNIDFEFLSRKFKMSGGNIKNIALSAAFLAAENSGKIDMRDIILSTKREFQKMGRLCIQSDFGKYYDLTLEH
jgi:ATP-dependent 26S proteasome regulatory subunit